MLAPFFFFRGRFGLGGWRGVLVVWSSLLHPIGDASLHSVGELPCLFINIASPRCLQLVPLLFLFPLPPSLKLPHQ